MDYHHIKFIIASFFVLLFIIIGCSKKQAIDIAAYKKEIEQWQMKRVDGLRKENGWLTLCGLFWLKEGENKFGTDSSNNIIFPSGKSQKYAGSILLEKDELFLKASRGAGIKYKDSLITTLHLQSDEKGNPTVLTIGTLTFNVIKRNGLLGVRIKDKNNPDRLNFKGLEYFLIDPKWRVEAKFSPYTPPKIIPIVNVLNQVSNDTCPGAIVFEIEGKAHRLDALQEGKELFIIFADETSGKETYGMGRFLYTNLADSNKDIIIDFNKAYNPPCAFTDFATCPTPPKQNRLPINVEAGEKKYSGHEH